jgi:hypothetical protein
VAELVNDLGLLKKEALRHLVELYRSWKSKRAAGLRSDFEHPEKRRTGVQIEACAVWDTVAALSDNRLGFVNESIPECVQLASHALALNEEREKFRPLLWEDADGRKLSQCWFLGTHSDVGGGNDEQQLANISLMWMISQLQHTLGFDTDVVRSLTSDPITKELHRKRSKGTRHSAISQAHPTEGYYELQLELPVQDFQARTGIKVGTASKLQRVLGWRYREPLKSGTKTREKIHWTVSVLIQKGIVAPCKPLEHAIGDLAHLPDDDARYEVRDDLEEGMIRTWIAHDCLQIARMEEECRSDLLGRKQLTDLPSSILPFYLVLLRPDEWRVQDTNDTRALGVQETIQVGLNMFEPSLRSHARLALHVQGDVCFKAHSDHSTDTFWERLVNLELNVTVTSTSDVGVSAGGVEVRWSSKTVKLIGQVRVPFDPSLCSPEVYTDHRQ